MSLLRRGLPFAFVAIVAAFFRLYTLDTIPPGLYGDEAANGLDASAIQRGDRLPLYIEADMKWQSQEALYHYLMAGVFAMFGTTATAIRLTSALIGIATVLGFFVLCGKLCGPRVAFLAASLLAVCRWHVTFSRIGFRGILVPLSIVLVLLAMHSLCKRRTPWTAVVFGATLALGFHTYPAYWIVPVPCIVVLGILSRRAAPESARRHRPVNQSVRVPLLTRLSIFSRAAPFDGAQDRLRDAAKRGRLLRANGKVLVTPNQMTPRPFVLRLSKHALRIYHAPVGPLALAAWSGVAFLAAASPLIGYAVAKPEYYFARAASTATPAQAPGDHRSLLLDNFQKSVFMLHLRGDTNPRHNIPGRPLLDPITGLSFLAGLWVVVKTFGTDTHLKAGLLLFWLLLLLPAAVTGEAPHALRSIGAIPAVCLISALGLERIAHLVTHRRAVASGGFALVAVAGATALNYQAYFHEWATNDDLAPTFSADVGRFFAYCADLAETNDLYACPYVYNGPQTRFFNLQRRAPLHRVEDATAFVAAGDNVRDRVFVCDVPAVNAFIEALYPQAEVIGRYAVYAQHSGRVYRVPRERLRASLTDEERAALAQLLAETQRRQQVDSGS